LGKSQTPAAQSTKENGGSSSEVAVVEESRGSTSEEPPHTDPRTFPDLSLVLPCYNEASHFADSIREIVRVLDATELVYEIILIDDGSTDETPQLIRSYLSGQHSKDVRAYFHDVNIGHGATVAEGIRESRSTYVGFIDINLETPPQFVPAALDPLMRHKADMVVGDRRTVRPLDAPLRLVMSRVYRWLASQLLHTDSLDTAAGFKFFRRNLILPVLDELQDPDWFWDTEITVVARAKGLRTYSLPVTYCQDLTKQSTDRVFHDSWRSLATLLVFAKRHRFA
jgi:glycosyltransferase involved in cell wall biosynthesis